MARVEANREVAALTADVDVTSAARAVRMAKREFYRQRALAKAEYRGPRGNGFTVPEEHRAFLRAQRAEEKSQQREIRQRDRQLNKVRYEKISNMQQVDKTLSQLNRAVGKPRQKWTAEKKSRVESPEQTAYARKVAAKKRQDHKSLLPSNYRGGRASAKSADVRIREKGTMKSRLQLTATGLMAPHRAHQRSGIGAAASKARRGDIFYVSLDPKKSDYIVTADGTHIPSHPGGAEVVTCGVGAVAPCDSEEAIEGTGITWGDI